ncbi:MAG: hypothetical protein Q9222_001513 [Ikaeria aurantiellina]
MANHYQIFISEPHLSSSEQLFDVTSWTSIDADELLADVISRSRINTPSNAQCYSAIKSTKAFNGSEPLTQESGLWGVTRKPDICRKNLPAILRNLYWRAGNQIVVFEVFAMLCERGLLNQKALATPIDYSRAPRNVFNVVNMLFCFTDLADVGNPKFDDGEYLEDFGSHVQWLAVMICRSCTDLAAVNEAMALIHRSGLLGHFSQPAVMKFNDNRASMVEKCINPPSIHYKKKNGKWKSKSRDKKEVPPLFEGNPNENAAAQAHHRIFGWLLPPDGEGKEDMKLVLDKAKAKFREIEDTYREYFGLSDEELAAEDDGDDDDDDDDDRPSEGSGRTGDREQEEPVGLCGTNKFQSTVVERTSLPNLVPRFRTSLASSSSSSSPLTITRSKSTLSDVDFESVNNSLLVSFSDARQKRYEAVINPAHLLPLRCRKEWSSTHVHPMTISGKRATFSQALQVSQLYLAMEKKEFRQSSRAPR